MHDRFDIWSIGPLEILTERRESNWRITWKQIHRTHSSFARRAVGISPEAAALTRSPSPSALCRYHPSPVQTLTIPSTSPNEDLVFAPVLPDAQLRMKIPFQAALEAGEKLTIGFLLPLVIRIDIATTHGGTREACEIPIHPLAATWLGSNPQIGTVGLCPVPVLSVERWSDYRPRLDYAGCNIHLINQGGTTLLIDEVTLPCGKLSLYHSPQTGFWTESMTIDVTNTLQPKIEKQFPKDAGAPVLVQPARIVAKSTAPGAAANGIKSIAAFGSNIGTSVGSFFKERG
jgi:hypothetical protein